MRVDLSGCYSKLCGEQFADAKRAMAEQIAKDASAEINSQSGRLASSYEVSQDGDRITWSSDYARHTFYKSKRGSKHWLQQARSYRAKKWARLLASEMTK